MILPLLRPNSALALARVSVENLKVTINMKHEYLYYCNRWFDGVKASLNPDYEDPKSVRRATMLRMSSEKPQLILVNIIPIKWNVLLHY